MDTTEAARRLRGIGLAVNRLADQLTSEGDVDPEHLDLAVAQLKGIRVRTFGRRRSSESARDRLRRYFVDNLAQEVSAEELAEVAGISEWARRVRELRAEGFDIDQPNAGSYRLVRAPDR